MRAKRHFGTAALAATLAVGCTHDWSRFEDRAPASMDGGVDAPTADAPTADAAADATLDGGATPPSLDLGGTASCALGASGPLAWGSNESGWMGRGSDAGLGVQLAPVAMFPGMGSITAIGCGDRSDDGADGADGHACVVHAGRVLCAGRNLSGQLGSGAVSAAEPDPVEVLGPSGGLLEDAVQVDVGGDHSCATTGDGRVLCWGSDALGQLGNGAAASVSTPMVVDVGRREIAEVRLGRASSCALARDGTVLCWGRMLGSDGRFARVDSPVVMTMPDEEPARVISVGREHACAVLDSGRLACWGAGSLGRLAHEGLDHAVATLASRITQQALSVACGAYHTCVLLSDHGVVCFGYDDDGQAGVDPALRPDAGTASVVVPQRILGLGPVEAIGAGGFHSCAVETEGRVLCWGYDGFGQLGDGASDSSSTPRVVTGLAL